MMCSQEKIAVSRKASWIKVPLLVIQNTVVSPVKNIYVCEYM